MSDFITVLRNEHNLKPTNYFQDFQLSSKCCSSLPDTIPFCSKAELRAVGRSMLDLYWIIQHERHMWAGRICKDRLRGQC